MTQVVDASAVVAMLLDAGPDGRWCEQAVLRDDLAAPELMPFEVANVIRRLLLHGTIDETVARRALDDLAALEVELVGFEAVATRVWELRGTLTSYDASYVALAEAMDARLVTLDARIARAPGVACEVAVAPGE